MTTPGGSVIAEVEIPTLFARDQETGKVFDLGAAVCADVLNGFGVPMDPKTLSFVHLIDRRFVTIREFFQVNTGVQALVFVSPLSASLLAKIERTDFA